MHGLELGWWLDDLGDIELIQVQGKASGEVAMLPSQFELWEHGVGVFYQGFELFFAGSCQVDVWGAHLIDCSELVPREDFLLGSYRLSDVRGGVILIPGHMISFGV